MNQYNPFEFDAAAKLSPEQILKLYIPNFTYSRFLSSRRNIFLEGERGSGKSIALRYNSIPVKCHRENGSADILLSEILCVYIPCNTPLTHRQEYELLENFPALIISEYFLVLNIMYHIAENLSHIPDIFNEIEEQNIRNELSYSLDIDFPPGSIFDALMLVFQKEVTEAEKAINKGEFEQLEGFSRSFSSGVLPLCAALRKATKLKHSHFAFLIDDAQELNRHQIQSLNSWIAYRDNSIFSFKVASTKVERPNKMTNSGGNILEGHDYLSLDMELPYQNMNKDFEELARQILEKRIDVIAPGVSVDDFFPEYQKLRDALDLAREEVMAEARELYPDYDQKQLNDYTYKRYRARYFNRRKPTANLPIYSGVETIISLSTGVVRNLLEPCFWMYDRVISESVGEVEIREVSPSVQHSVILGRSRKKWDSIKDDLVKTIVGCSRRDAERIYNLLEKLCELFRKRLSLERSEPRAVMFTISETSSPVMEELLRVIAIARKARLIYVYRSSGKTMGAREDYYVPNRLLLPERGLDPVGQHARVSLRAMDLWNAAERMRSLPGGELDEDENNQPELL